MSHQFSLINHESAPRDPRYKVLFEYIPQRMIVLYIIWLAQRQEAVSELLWWALDVLPRWEMRHTKECWSCLLPVRHYRPYAPPPHVLCLGCTEIFLDERNADVTMPFAGRWDRGRCQRIHVPRRIYIEDDE